MEAGHGRLACRLRPVVAALALNLHHSLEFTVNLQSARVLRLHARGLGVCAGLSRRFVFSAPALLLLSTLVVLLQLIITAAAF